MLCYPWFRWSFSVFKSSFPASITFLRFYFICYFSTSYLIFSPYLLCWLLIILLLPDKKEIANLSVKKMEPIYPLYARKKIILKKLKVKGNNNKYFMFILIYFPSFPWNTELHSFSSLNLGKSCDFWPKFHKQNLD